MYTYVRTFIHVRIPVYAYAHSYFSYTSTESQAWICCISTYKLVSRTCDHMLFAVCIASSIQHMLSRNVCVLCAYVHTNARPYTWLRAYDMYRRTCKQLFKGPLTCAVFLQAHAHMHLHILFNSDMRSCTHALWNQAHSQRETFPTCCAYMYERASDRLQA